MNDDPSREATPPEDDSAEEPESAAGGEAAEAEEEEEEILDLEGQFEEGRRTPPKALPFKLPKLEESGMKLLVENVRAQVARGLVAILAVVILFSFLTLWLLSPPPGLADLEKLLTIIFGPLVALVSGAVGYYFGGKSDEEQQQQKPEGENEGGGQ